MFRDADLSQWKGRIDIDDAGDTRRLHQVVRTFSRAEARGVVLLGFCSDEGVRRNGGRFGAVDAPDKIRALLAPMAWHAGGRSLADAGNVVCEGPQLEQAQYELEGYVARLIRAGDLPIVIGGGHEVAFGTAGGVLAARPLGAKVGLINIDAHFDLRAAPMRNSGTSFADLAARCTSEGREFRYLCIGISETSNTGALFERARSLGAQWITDEVVRASVQEVSSHVRAFVESCDDIYLSIDMDAMPAYEAPGVSAPAALGIPFETVLSVVRQVSESAKMRAVDIAEVNPRFDIDDRTARLAARLIHSLIHSRLA
jgi:formiminoglutamase